MIVVIAILLAALLARELIYRRDVVARQKVSDQAREQFEEKMFGALEQVSARHERQLESAAKERRELITRIQHPRLIPIDPNREIKDPPPAEPDEYGLVGAVLPYSEDEE